MLSLYIHIPFCAHKCSYCSFFVLPENNIESVTRETKLETIKEQYLQSLLKENKHRYEQFPQEQIKTIYIGGGTPFQLGSERLFQLIDSLLETRDTEFLEELTIELNPDPFDEILDFIRTANKKYQKIYRLRFSIGIQSFDDKILEKSGRNYYFNNLIGFFRELQLLKQPQTSFNFDFIAFGGSHMKNFELWDKVRIEFFEKLVKSHLADGYSIYTLELFPGSERYNSSKLQASSSKQKTHLLQGDEDAIYDEFILLSDIVERAGYHRYETSNFALRGKRSLHNMVYREMGNYLGLGINSSSFINCSLSGSKIKESRDLSTLFSETLISLRMTDGLQGIRFQNTKHRKFYLTGEWMDKDSIEPLHAKDYMIEKAFLSLRTDHGLKDIEHIGKDIFVDNRKELLMLWQREGLIFWDQKKDSLVLTDGGFALYNTIITDLLHDL